MRTEQLARIGWMALVMVAGVRGEEREIAVGLEATHFVPPAVLARAKATATQIYAGIGVKLRWRNPAAAEIRMEFDTGVAAREYQDAMGYAMPYAKAGTRIHIFLDRVVPDRLCSPRSQEDAGVLLGHVMAHELGHVLEGISWHADSGIMKANWNLGDRRQMLDRSLSFSSADVDLIRLGLARMTARPIADAPVVAELR